jgi:hypothetical protein
MRLLELRAADLEHARTVIERHLGADALLDRPPEAWGRPLTSSIPNRAPKDERSR